MSTQKPVRNNKAVLSWGAFDWASSPVPTLHATFIFSVYFTTTVMPDGGSAAWAWLTAAASLMVAIAAPFLGKIADRRGASKTLLAIVTIGGVVATGLLWFIKPDPSFVILAILLSFISIFMMEISFVFYNALLPGIARPKEYGRVSGMAWGFGYAGAIVALAIVLALFVMPENPPFGLDKASAEHIRITMVFAALWFAVFALPLFLFVPKPAPVKTSGQFWDELKIGLRTAAAIPGMVRFLIARMLFTDGLITLFAFGGIYAAKIFGFTQTMVLIFGILLNITAGLGAAISGWADDKFGSIWVIRISLVALIILGSAAIIAPNEMIFWIAGALLGIFIGPLQSSSRVFVARRAPEDQRASLFGLMMLSGKATSFVGPLCYGLLVTLFTTERAGMA
ncbi:MFS transporter, partial [Alphaproteobacteria bacterium]|nr:MFS transporter [Alphaproteobacteria bacterium]